MTTSSTTRKTYRRPIFDDIGGQSIYAFPHPYSSLTFSHRVSRETLLYTVTMNLTGGVCDLLSFCLFGVGLISVLLTRGRPRIPSVSEVSPAFPPHRYSRPVILSVHSPFSPQFFLYCFFHYSISQSVSLGPNGTNNWEPPAKTWTPRTQGPIFFS